MTFWGEVLATILGGVATSFMVVFCYVLLQWFLRATDITVGYVWKWSCPNWYPSFDARNRSPQWSGEKRPTVESRHPTGPSEVGLEDRSGVMTLRDLIGSPDISRN
jgi:hypothetical protein